MSVTTPRRLGPDDLVLTNGCASYSSFETQVRVAADLGYSGISIWPNVYSEALARGLTPDSLRALLDDHGVVLNDVDAAILWAGSGDRPPRTPHHGPPYEVLFEAGAELGADYCNIAIFADGGYSFAKAVDVFAAAATRAIDAGMRPHLEFMPLGPIADATTAARVVEAAAIADAGFMIDAFHVLRGPTDDAQLLALSPERIFGVQLCDGGAQPADDLLWEALHGRLLPGEGAADVVGMIRLLDAVGSRAPFAVEVLNDELAQLPPAQSAATIAASARACLASARR